MDVEVVSPEVFTGDIVGNLSARRGSIGGMEPRGVGLQAIRAHVPLAEMFGYATELRSMTQGRGTFTMEFAYYDQVPDVFAQQILSGWRK